MLKKAVYPGSFDPFTNGHLDIVERALKVVDELTIAVLRNSSKQNLFSPRQRVEQIKEIFKFFLLNNLRSISESCETSTQSKEQQFSYLALQLSHCINNKLQLTFLQLVCSSHASLHW